jgi:hypothetical protein
MSLERVVVWVVMAASLAGLAFARRPHDRDGVAAAVAQIEHVARVDDLPATVGYLGFADEATQASGDRYQTQYALAPRLLTDDLAIVDVVLSARGAPASLDQDSRLGAFVLVRVAPGGIRVYRRQVRP